MKLNDLDKWMARSPLLLIDSDTKTLEILSRMLEWAGFLNVMSFTSAKEAFSKLNALLPHLVILDVNLVGMDGYEFLEKTGQAIPNRSFMPILVFTGDLTPEAKIRALQLGASDFLTKPGDAIEIQLRIRNFLRFRKTQSELQNHNQILETMVQQRTEHLLEARREAVELLGRASEYRDDDTGKHATRVGEISSQVALTLGLDEDFVESIRLVAPLHDVGKIAVPDQILRKPARLTPEETTIMRRHVQVGGDLLADLRSPQLQMARDVVLYHHERWDGSGYAAGLAGEDIPLCARIVAVADAFDAMTHNRPYQVARSEREALEEIKGFAGMQFDPEVVKALATMQENAKFSHKVAV